MKVLTLEDLLIEENLAMIAETGSVLVVCSDESDGESLLAVSQSLRNRPHIHRHYVIGHLFPTSSQQFKRLKSNLRVNGKGKEYGWSVYCVTPIGDELAFQTWLYERDFDYSNIKLNKSSKPLMEALVKRTQHLNGSSLAGNQLFLPRVSGEALELRDESVLFEKGYDNISQVTIFVQIAAALQRARDQVLFNDRVLPDGLCFQNNPFIDSVIDPDTFSRFNDGVIQAAILRACEASELNYSRDFKLSQYMRDIFLGLVRSRSGDLGEAVLEFVFAIYLQKIRFHKKHYPKVNEVIMETPELKAIWSCFEISAPF